MPGQLSRLLFHATNTSPWLFRPVKVSNSSKHYPGYFWLPTFLDFPGIQFFLFTPFLTQSDRLPLVTYPSLCSACVNSGTPYQAIAHRMFLTQLLPRKAEDVPGGDKHPGYVALLIYLVLLQPIINNSTLVFRLLKTESILLVVKSLAKKHNK